jgi:tRNA-dihydrouridine synthase B
MYTGNAEYDTIKAVKAAIAIPVVANGDITTPEMARFVLDFTGADAVMIGRAAQGRPWIFREIQHYLETGEHLPPPEVEEIRLVMMEHLEDRYRFYGREAGARIARKHISWYTKGLSGSAAFRRQMNMLLTAEEQLAAINEFFDRLAEHNARLRYIGGADDQEQNEEQALAA